MIAHLNIVSLTGDVYVDPEDWSTHRTRYLGSIGRGGSQTITWRLKAVSSGRFGVYVAVLRRGGADRPPITAPLVAVHVAGRTTLNAGGILSVALVVPACIGVFTLGLRLRGAAHDAARGLSLAAARGARRARHGPCSSRRQAARPRKPVATAHARAAIGRARLRQRRQPAPAAHPRVHGHRRRQGDQRRALGRRPRQDIDGGQIVEEAIDYLSIDANGTVWYRGSYTEGFEGGRSVSALDGWLDGRQGAKAGIFMPARPRAGSPSYYQQQVPGEEATTAQVVKTHQTKCVPFRCFGNVVVILEDGEEYKYFAPGVGGIRTEPRSSSGPDETEDLVNVRQLGGRGLAEVSAEVLKLDRHARTTMPAAFAGVPAATRKP